MQVKTSWSSKAIAAALALFAGACATTGAPAPSTPLISGHAVSAPTGFIDFCLSDPEACGGATSIAIRPQVEMTDALWDDVNAINLHANRTIRYVADGASGQFDLWRVATDFGDCEDYALAKRQALIEAGFPAAALRLATVYSRRTGPHAVLVLSTTDGDYVLDNTRDRILPWRQTEFAWVSIQSDEDPTQWLRVANRASDMAHELGPTAGG